MKNIFASRTTVPFYKMNGTRNDFVLFDGRALDDAPPEPEIQAICDRKSGVGADGILLLETGRETPFRMVMYNPDGSRPEMCGNGIRCFARLLYDLGEVRETSFPVETDAGRKEIQLRLDDQEASVEAVRVNMGTPGLRRSEVPMKGPDGTVRDERIEAAGEQFEVTAVSTGNPHITIYTNDVESVPLEEWGPALEHHSAFPEDTNVHFVEVRGEHELRQKTWERGAGKTEACGTGACGITVSSIVTGRVSSPVNVILDGGELTVSWDEDGAPIYMEGPAEYGFTGEWPVRHSGWASDD